MPRLAAQGLVLGFLGLLLAVPLAALAFSGNGQGRWPLLTEPYFDKVILWTMGQALASALLSGLVALPIAWTLAHLEGRAKRLYRGVVILPFVTPVVVAAMALISLLGPRGLWPVTGESSPALLILGNVFYNLGLVVWFVNGALERLPAGARAAARTLGASPWRVFLRVEWPVVRPALVAALTLTFLFCASSFGLALMLAGRAHATIEVEIYSLTAYDLDLGGASVLALVHFLVAILAVLLQARLDRRLSFDGQGAPLGELESLRGGTKRLAWTGLILAGLVLAAPLIALAARAVGSFGVLFADPAFVLAFSNSLRFAGLTTFGGGLLGALVAFSFRTRGMGGVLAYLPYTVSGTVLAVGYLLAYPAWTASLALLLAAYVLMAYPFVARQLGLAWANLPRHLPGAARCLGATPIRAARRVVLPLLVPALRQGLALAWASALGEFAVNLLLSRPEWLSLTRFVYERLGRPGERNLGEAMAAAVVLLALAWISLFLIGGVSLHAGRGKYFETL